MPHCIARHGASIHETTGPPHKSPLQLAAAGGHLEVRGRSHNNNRGATLQVMEEMSRHYNAGAGDWRQRDDWGWTLLHEAAHTARPDIIQVTACNIKKTKQAPKHSKLR